MGAIFRRDFACAINGKHIIYADELGFMPADNHQRQDDMVCLPRTEFESLLEQAACRGARKALKEVGLADEEAANDIRTLRDLAGSIKTMQRTFLQTVVRWITIGVLALLVAGVAAKLGPFTPK